MNDKENLEKDIMSVFNMSKEEINSSGIDLSIIKYKNDDGDGYTYTDECYYETATDLIATGILGFCGCGCPEEALVFIRDILQFIKQKINEPWSEKLENKEKELFPYLGMNYFIYYWLDNKELTEHGSSVPGWLTKKGEQLLKDLTIILKEEKEFKEFTNPELGEPYND